MSARFLAPLSALSGSCALAYEILWARMLGIQFGVSAFAAVVTVSAFMLGLAGGSAFMAGRAGLHPRPLRLLALLEAAIALFALSLPWVVHWATPIIDAAAGYLPPPQWHALLVLAGLLSLTLPAAAMGAGFPLLVEGFARRGGSIGAAYGSNTIGAAVGALLPLFLLPAVGWTAAVRGVAALNVIVAAGFFMLDGRGRTGDGRPVGASSAHDAASARKPSGLLLLTYAAIGAASLLLEMAWLRLFSLAMLRTEYVLALILAVMLLGMGLGSLVAARQPKGRALAALPWCASGYALAGLWLLPHVSALLERTRFYSMGAATMTQALLLVVLTLPVTLSLGAWLPALTARFDTDGTRLYACNSLGAALGGLFYVILTPLIGSAGALALAAVLLLLSGLILARSYRAWAGVPVLMAAAWSVSALPPVRDFLPQAMAGTRDLYRYEDAIAITQVVEQSDGQRVLLTDMRRQDGSTDPTAVFVQSNQSRLPLLLDPGRAGSCSSVSAPAFRSRARWRFPTWSAVRWNSPPAASRPRAAGSPTAIERSCRTPGSITTTRVISLPQRAKPTTPSSAMYFIPISRGRDRCSPWSNSSGFARASHRKVSTCNGWRSTNSIKTPWPSC